MNGEMILNQLSKLELQMPKKSNGTFKPDSLDRSSLRRLLLTYLLHEMNGKRSNGDDLTGINRRFHVTAKLQYIMRKMNLIDWDNGTLNVKYREADIDWISNRLINAEREYVKSISKRARKKSYYIPVNKQQPINELKPSDPSIKDCLEEINRLVHIIQAKLI